MTDSPQTVPKPRIGLVTDTNNWAFANIARQITKNLSDRFDFETIALSNDTEHVAQVFLRFRDFDLVHFFWRDILTLVDKEDVIGYFRDRGWDYAYFRTTYLHELRKTTSVYDHLFLTEPEIQARIPLFNDIAWRYTVCSEKLNQIYRGIECYPDPSHVVEDGVDLDLFYPRNLERLGEDREIVVGWAGNSQWNADNGDFKGLETIIKPAIQQLQSEGYKVRSLFADRAEGFIPHHAMVDFYNQLDVYVCASIIEGTPNPVMEAAACGVPFISTDVGIVPQVSGPLQRDFILTERSSALLAEKIKALAVSPSLRVALSQENQQSIQGWTWANQTRKFGDFFDAALRA